MRDWFVRVVFYVTISILICSVLFLSYPSRRIMTRSSDCTLNATGILCYQTYPKYNIVNTTSVTTMRPVILRKSPVPSNSNSSMRMCGKSFQSKNSLFPSQNDADCRRLFAGDIHYMETLHAGFKSDKYDRSFIKKLTSNCSSTLEDFSNTFYVSAIEKELPIAFEVLIYYKPIRILQYIKLLKNIYRPQNVYCIHIDKKSPKWWSQSFKDFANCFPNVIIARDPLNVVYASSSILYAHFKCFHELLQSTRDWKYVISLHGTEIPLVTNRQMAEVLQKMNGSNIISKGVEAVKHKMYNSWLVHKAVALRDNHNVKVTNERLGAIPYNISVFKSAASANSALSRKFVNFIFTDKRALAFAQYLKNVKSAVEFFFSTINFFPDAPGGLHTLPQRFKMPLIAQRDWMISQSQLWAKGVCEGRKIVNSICIVSIRDLPRLQKVSENMSWWFHNKYFFEYDHIVMDCMENLLIQRNVMEHENDCRLESL